MCSVDRGRVNGSVRATGEATLGVVGTAGCADTVGIATSAVDITGAEAGTTAA
jgi:hypothetical protein